MNLEAIEQRVLAYLENVSNPLVRIEVLYAHLADHDLAGSMDVAQLKGFLMRHDRVRVLDPPAEFASTVAGEPGGSFAIARDRVPTQQQLVELMREQLDVLLEALRSAREEALEVGDSTRLSQIDHAQRQAAALREKLSSEVPRDGGDRMN